MDASEYSQLVHSGLEMATWGSGPLLCMAWYSSLQGTGFNLSKYRWCYEFGGVSHCFVRQGYLCLQVACIHRYIIHRIIPLKNSRNPKRDPYKFSQPFLLLFSHTVIISQNKILQLSF